MSSIHGFSATLISAGLLVFICFVIFSLYRCWIQGTCCWSMRKDQRRSHPVLHLNNQQNSQTLQNDPKHTERQRYHPENIQRNDQRRSRPVLYSIYLLNMQTRQDDQEHTDRQRSNHENIQRNDQRRSRPMLYSDYLLNLQTRQDDTEHTGREGYQHENVQRNDQRRSRPMLYSDYLLNLQTRQDDTEHTGKQRNHHENIQRNDHRPSHSMVYSDTMQFEGSASFDNTEYQQNSQICQNDSEHTGRQIHHHENYTRDNIFTPKGLPSYDDAMSVKFDGNIQPPPSYAEVMENNLGAVGQQL